MGSIASQIEFLKRVIAITMGLSITTTIQKSVINLQAEFSFYKLFAFIFLILTIVRFFYGNWMHLERTLSRVEAAEDHTRGKTFLINYLIVISQSILFTIISVFDPSKTEFFYVFSAVLLIDVVGFTILGLNDTDSTLERSWTYNNFVAIAILLAIALSISDLNTRLYLSLVICSINTMIGLALSWRLYYPII